ncbi:MAG: gamma carbonic anhydrase family protein [Saprospiraceae bacterium]|nr:gamma carbonic anhydrase family protein [Saprospiraceae bacterium]
MPLILEVRGFIPKIHDSCFIAENATIVGDVEIGQKSSVWFNAVIRGDVNSIKIGSEVNIQDGAIIHCTYEKSITEIGDRVSVGHNAIVHGCKIESDVLIGMGSIIMDHAYIPSHVIIGAGAVVPENMILESGFIYTGVPAKKLKVIDKDNFQFFIERTAKNYQMYSYWFKK